MADSDRSKGGLERIREYYADVDKSTSTQNGVFIVNPDAVERIVGLFAEDGIYDRQNAKYHGTQAIKGFFSRERSLCGSHAIVLIKASDGIPIKESLRTALGKLPAPSECQTIFVKGRFSGKMFITQGEQGARGIKQEHPAELNFVDYWILHKGKVLYRQSDIYPVRLNTVQKTTLRY